MEKEGENWNSLFHLRSSSDHFETQKINNKVEIVGQSHKVASFCYQAREAFLRVIGHGDAATIPTVACSISWCHTTTLLLNLWIAVVVSFLCLYLAFRLRLDVENWPTVTQMFLRSFSIIRIGQRLSSLSGFAICSCRGKSISLAQEGSKKLQRIRRLTGLYYLESSYSLQSLTLQTISSFIRWLRNLHNLYDYLSLCKAAEISACVKRFKERRHGRERSSEKSRRKE